MHDFQEQCQVHGQQSKNMACRKQTVFGAIMHLSLFALKQYIMKQLLVSVFVISEIIKVSVRVISLSQKKFGHFFARVSPQFWNVRYGKTSDAG